MVCGISTASFQMPCIWGHEILTDFSNIQEYTKVTF